MVIKCDDSLEKVKARYRELIYKLYSFKNHYVAREFFDSLIMIFELSAEEKDKIFRAAGYCSYEYKF